MPSSPAQCDMGGGKTNTTLKTKVIATHFRGILKNGTSATNDIILTEHFLN